MKKTTTSWEYIQLVCSLKIVKTMRNILILSLLTVFQIFANDSYSQSTRLSLDLEDATIEQVLAVTHVS